MSVTITQPANDGDPFPDPVRGTYSVPGPSPAKPDKGDEDARTAARAAYEEDDETAAAAASLLCSIPAGYELFVTISSATAGFNQTIKASLTCSTDTTGTWRVRRPNGLPDATDYVIDADDGDAGDSKSSIHSP